MQVIIYTNEYGNVSVCSPVGELPIEEVKLRNTPPNSIIVDSEILPTEDGDFFDAWELNNDIVSVNLNKAKLLTKDRLRIERKPLLEALDIDFQKALEMGADTTDIISKKNHLRNITTLVDECNSLDELRSLNCS